MLNHFCAVGFVPAIPGYTTFVHARADFDMVESNALPRRPSPLPGGERSDRACAIRVRGKPANNRLRSPLTRNGRAMRAHSDLSPPGRGEKHSLNVIGKCSSGLTV